MGTNVAPIPPDLKGTLPEPPLDELEKLSTEFEGVPVYFKQRNNKAQWVQLETKEFTIGDLMTDTIGNYLRENYGGGAFICEPRHPEAPSQRLVKPWHVNVIGPPKIRTTGMIEGRAPSNNEMQAGYRAGFVPSLAGQVAQPGVRPSDIMTFTSDAVAMEQLRETREENKRLKEEARNRERNQQQKHEALQKQLEELRLQNERARAEAREAELRGQIEQIKQLVTHQQNQAPQKPTVDIVGLIAGFAPVLIAMISTSKDRQAMQLEAQQKSSEQQSTMLAAVLKRPEENPLKSLLELAVPLISTLVPKFMEANNPSKMADMITTMGENQMQMVALAAQAIRDLAPDQETPGMQFARAIIEGVTNMAEQVQMRAQANQQPQHVQTQLMPQQRSPAMPQQATVVDVTTSETQPPPAAVQGAQNGRQTRPAPQQPRNARELAQAITSDPLWPAQLKTPAWTRLLTTLHSYDRNPVVVGEEIAKMLEGMMKTKQLPPEILVMFEDDGPPPNEVLQPIFAALPIAQTEELRPFYIKVLETIDSMYTDDEDEESHVEIADADNNEPGEAIEAAHLNGNGAADDEDLPLDDEQAAFIEAGKL